MSVLTVRCCLTLTVRRCRNLCISTHFDGVDVPILHSCAYCVMFTDQSHFSVTTTPVTVYSPMLARHKVNCEDCVCVTVPRPATTPANYKHGQLANT